jgi:RNA processing factor Prp31
MQTDEMSEQIEERFPQLKEQPIPPSRRIRRRAAQGRPERSKAPYDFDAARKKRKEAKKARRRNRK